MTEVVKRRLSQRKDDYLRLGRHDLYAYACIVLILLYFHVRRNKSFISVIPFPLESSAVLKK